MKIYRVQDMASGHGGYYYAPTIAAAKAMQRETLEAWVVNELELVHVVRSGAAIVGLPPMDENDPQGRFSMEPPTQEE
jgi:hypothetical protein